MRLLARMAELVFWFALWIAIPAALLYPVAAWMATHTDYSVDILVQGYLVGVGLLFFPTGLLVHFLYRKFILKKRIPQLKH